MRPSALARLKLKKKLGRDTAREAVAKTLREQVWFHGDISRQEAETILKVCFCDKHFSRAVGSEVSLSRPPSSYKNSDRCRTPMLNFYRPVLIRTIHVGQPLAARNGNFLVRRTLDGAEERFTLSTTLGNTVSHAKIKYSVTGGFCIGTIAAGQRTFNQLTQLVSGLCRSDGGY